MSNKLKVGLIGKDGRTSAIVAALCRSPLVGEEGIVRLSEWKSLPEAESRAEVLLNAKREHVDFVIVGPEEPLEAGIVDDLLEAGIPSVGPTSSLARLESSKSFTRELVAKYGIPGNPKFKIFNSFDEEAISSFVRELALGGGFVVKPDGLTGGKGVKVSDVHLFSIEEAVDYCKELVADGGTKVLIEEKLDGEEFSLMAFCDGRTVKDMVVVQDHKRVGEGDTGPNTGGMGSYTCPDHGLPFLTPTDLQKAGDINKAIAAALLAETGHEYKGILYGGFIATKDGVKLIEYNARFGDPEALNVLALLETDFALVCQSMIGGTLDKIDVKFSNKATVCKYVVPEGYPDNPVKGLKIENIAQPSPSLHVYEAAVLKQPDGYYLTGSRAIAFVGIASSLEEAERIAEKAASAVAGPVIHRSDIGSADLLAVRIEHMKQVRSGKVTKPSFISH